MSFEASFSTECETCEEMIQPGQLVEYNTRQRVVHVFCPEAREMEPLFICSTCFMELPLTGICGECG